MASGRSIFRLHCQNYGTKAPVTSPKRVIFSGIQPTGVPHLGNYFGALSQWEKLQRISTSPQDKFIFSVMGYHALTLPQNPDELASNRLDAMASILAVGVDPKASIIFYQDEMPAHAELAWILNCITPIGKLQRMTTWKSKLAISRNANNEQEVNESQLNLGLFAYPVLQAADILLYKTTHVPVGEDQVQHLELARELASIFNRKFKCRLFSEPQCLLSPDKRILSLRDPSQKMSKSAPDANSRILLTDTAEMISQKLRRATTDSIAGITYDPIQRPGVSNLLEIFAACTDESVDTVALRYTNKVHSDLKQDLADALDVKLGPIRSEFQKIRNDVSWVNEVAASGRMRAGEIAGQVMKEVREKVGLR